MKKIKMKSFILILLVILSIDIYSEDNKTSGKNSPIVSTKSGDVYISYEKNDTENFKTYKNLDRFSLDLSVFEEGDIPDELGKDIVIIKKDGKKAISGLRRNIKGKIIIKNLTLKNKFRVELSYFLFLTGVTEFILRTKDDNIANDIKIRVNGEYLTFGDKTKHSSDIAFNHNGIDDFSISKNNKVIKLHINNNYFSSIKVNNNYTYDKLIINGIKQIDFIYNISAYNLND